MINKTEKMIESTQKLNDIEEKIRRINGAMALEGMPLTNEIKDNIRKCLKGESTIEKECQKAIERHRQPDV